MSLSHVSDSVRVALGSDADCRALLEKLSQTALPTRMCETVDDLIAFQPAAVVLAVTRIVANTIFTVFIVISLRLMGHQSPRFQVRSQSRCLHNFLQVTAAFCLFGVIQNRLCRVFG